MKRMIVCSLGAASLMLCAVSQAAVDYKTKVKPILLKHCVDCHGAEKQKGDLRLDRKEASHLKKHGEEAILIPGKPEKSLFLQRILLAADHDDVMPPPKKARLNDQEVLTLVKWVQEGAAWPAEPKPAPAKAAPVAATPAAAPAQVTYTKHIKPIFDARCIDCHGEDKQKEDLRVDTYAWIFKGAEEGHQVVIPGKPEKSELYEVIVLPADDDDIMPPKGDPLSKDQIALVKTWILQGAKE